ncbi:MAG: putative zinc protease-like protein y4wB [Dehalococcoidia bacterium]|nr:MAG: putative zinc protease-like protein y4wB [Dehalococcoidia bacterium]
MSTGDRRTAAGAPPLPSETAIARQTLPNGALLLVKERPTSGVVAITVALRSGARDESADDAGARNLLARAHLLGTARWPTEDQLRRAIGATGGGIGVSASQELTTISVTVPVAEQQLAFEVLADVLNAPRFDADQIIRDRNLVLLDIRRRSADPAPLAFDTLLETVWRDHPGGHSVLGRAETVERIDRDRLLELRQRAVVGANLTVAVVGQITAERAFAELTNVLGSLPAGAPADRTPHPLPPRAGDERIGRFAGQRQAIVLVGLPIPGRRDPDRYALAVLDAVLGSPSGRLFAEIRTNRALAYVAGSGLSLMSDAGLFYAQAGTEPGNVERVIELISSELRRLIERPLTAEELGAAAGQLAGRRIMAEETSAAQANQIASLTALGSYESAESFAENVRRVTADDVQRVAERYLGAGRTIVVVQPAAG